MELTHEDWLYILQALDNEIGAAQILVNEVGAHDNDYWRAELSTLNDLRNRITMEFF